MTDKNKQNQGNNPKPGGHGVGIGKGQNIDTNYNGGDNGRSIIGNIDNPLPFTITQHFSTPPRPDGNKPKK